MDIVVIACPKGCFKDFMEKVPHQETIRLILNSSCPKCKDQVSVQRVIDVEPS